MRQLILLIAIVTTSSLLLGYDDKGSTYELPITMQADAGIGKIEFIKTHPEIRFHKWNSEVNVGVRYASLGQKTVQISGDTLEWKDIIQEVHAYSIDNDNFEIEVVLNSKPATNIFEFQIDGASHLDFFYQGPLNTEDLGPFAVSCTETECIDIKNNIVKRRPENVVGSYAVYHKTKANHEVGGINYATGKAFHIYRPKAIDSVGAEEWATLVYSTTTEILSVEVPQSFLDNANYPVRVDPTFGYTSIGASQDTWGLNYLVASKAASTPASNGTLNSMSIYAKYNTLTSNFIPALYSDSSDLPDSRLAQVTSGGAAFGATFDWVTTNISYGSITSSTQYWLAHASEGNQYYDVKYDTATDEAQYLVPASPWPDPFGTPVGNFDERISIYATYTAAGGATITGGTMPLLGM